MELIPLSTIGRGDISGTIPDKLRIVPSLEDECAALLCKASECHDLVSTFGSPLNILFPRRVDHNVDSFLQTFEHYNIRGRVYCTTKPNRSSAVLRQIAHRVALGVDVSSQGALVAALGAGVCAERLEATGPKNDGYLTLALLHGVVINIDDITELDRMIDIRRSLRLTRKIPILVRLSAFSTHSNAHSQSDGTFGIPVQDLPLLFSRLEPLRNDVNLKGFSFHLNSDSITHRVSAMEQCLLAVFEGRNRGFSPDVIDLGGGFRIRYAAHDQQWAQFLIQLKSSLIGTSQMCTWNGSGLGFSSDGRAIKGAARFMDHVEPLSPADQLCGLLRQSLPSFSGISAAQLLSEALLEVWIEPGRAILDQVGVTLGRVITVRKTERGIPLVVMEMNRSNLNSFEISLLTDPIHIPSHNRQKSSLTGYFITGNLCVSNELLTPRMIFFDQEVTQGDILAFCNTAPYIMDFAESHTLHQPVARKIAGYYDDGKFRWSLDDEYQPQPRR